MYEYKIARSVYGDISTLEKQINKLAEEGWEAISIGGSDRNHGHQNCYVLSRRLKKS